MKHKKIEKKFLKSLRPFASRKNIVSLQIMLIVGGISLLLTVVSANFIRNRNLKLIKEKRQSAYTDEVRRLSGISSDLIPAPDITEGWNTYENKAYSFSLKYPSGWQTPQEIAPDSNVNYLLKIAFDEKGLVSEQDQKGFDIFVYDSKKFPDPAGTDSLKTKGENIQPKDCLHFDNITLGQNKYPAEEIFVNAKDLCYEETFFYSLTQDGHTYNIVPREGKKSDVFPSDAKSTLIKTFPEFYDVVSTLNLEKRESSFVQVPKKIIRNIVSPPPVRFVAGPSCAHKNDHPSYSNKGKGKHMDEDCCPDPDEWPNPGCSYSSHSLAVMKARPKG